MDQTLFLRMAHHGRVVDTAGLLLELVDGRTRKRDRFSPTIACFRTVATDPPSFRNHLFVESPIIESHKRLYEIHSLREEGLESP
jgi:hypothetical protein